MAKIAIVTSPFLGHFLPTIAVGRELMLLGHQLYWIGMNEGMAEKLPAGGKYIHFNAEPIAQNNEKQEHHGLESLMKLYQNVLIPLNKAMYKGIYNCLLSEPFDLVITDHQAFIGAIAAYQLNIPIVTSVTAPAAIDQSKHFPEVINFEKEQIVALQNIYGIKLMEPLVCNSPLTLVYSTTEFLQNNDFPSSYKFIGPTSANQKPDHTILAREISTINFSIPTVFISLGSILKPNIEFIDKVIDAFENEPITVILVAEPFMKEKWPANFHVFPFVPQLTILEKSDAVICHAGYNTICEALSFGLPIITLPIVNDQSYVATKVNNCGAGIRLKFRRLTSSQLRESLKDVLTNTKYKKSAEKVQESFRNAGGAKRAAQHIEKYLMDCNKSTVISKSTEEWLNI